MLPMIMLLAIIGIGVLFLLDSIRRTLERIHYFVVKGDEGKLIEKARIQNSLEEWSRELGFMPPVNDSRPRRGAPS